MSCEQMLKALGGPIRLKIFNCLLERKHCVRSLSRELGISESAVSQHLKVMREAGLIYGERHGYHIHYLPKQEALDRLVDLFADMRQKSKALNRARTVCQCEYKRRGK